MRKQTTIRSLQTLESMLPSVARVLLATQSLGAGLRIPTRPVLVMLFNAVDSHIRKSKAMHGRTS